MNVPESKIKYDILSYGSSGIFGLVGFKKARICVYNQNDGSSTTVEQESTVENEEIQAGIDDHTERPETVSVLPDEEEKTDDAGVDELEDLGREKLQHILDAVTDDAKISIHRNRTEVCFDVSGGDSGILIGKKGQTLEAMQYLLEKMVRKNNPKRLRIKVDVEGYLRSREDNLIKQSINMAQKVKKTGKPVVVGQMNPHDRRIVHVALKGHPGVRTQSKGDGFIRKIIILPQKNSRRKSNSQNSNTRSRKD